VSRQTMLIDSFGRSITYIRVSVTQHCNLRCLYCMDEDSDPEQSEELLTFAEIERILRVGCRLGLSKVRITGGEPLLRPGLATLITTIASIPALSAISITTNGVLLEQHAQEIHDTGVNSINISLDSLQRERFEQITHRDLFIQVWQGIQAAIALPFSSIKINVVLTRGINDDEIINFFRLTQDYPLQVRFIEPMPLGPEGFWQRDKVVSAIEILERIRAEEELVEIDLPCKVRGPARIYQTPGAPGTIGLISPVSHDFCETCNRIRLLADGKLRGCLIAGGEVNLRPALRGDEDDKQLEDLFHQAVQLKPEQHHINDADYTPPNRSMPRIGG
jgi:GTP 3',8-cyclase